MNVQQFLHEWDNLKRVRNDLSLNRELRLYAHEAMQMLRRFHNRQVMREYMQETKVSLPMAKMGETVLVRDGIKTYYPPMEG